MMALHQFRPKALRMILQVMRAERHPHAGSLASWAGLPGSPWPDCPDRVEELLAIRSHELWYQALQVYLSLGRVTT